MLGRIGKEHAIIGVVHSCFLTHTRQRTQTFPSQSVTLALECKKVFTADMPSQPCTGERDSPRIKESGKIGAIHIKQIGSCFQRETFSRVQYMANRGSRSFSC